MNRDWRGKNKPTDVLSFPQQSLKELRALSLASKKGSKDPWGLGDIVISLDRSKAQAKERGHSHREELEILLAHGLLHLLGFDHEESRAEALKMRRMERKLLGRTMIEF